MPSLLTCVVCPLGCGLSVETAGGEVSVSGNQCRRGRDYAREEAVRPMRILTTTVAFGDPRLAALPVKSDAPIPRDKLPACVRALAEVRAEAPIRRGDLLLADICGSGANLVAARSFPFPPD